MRNLGFWWTRPPVCLGQFSATVSLLRGYYSRHASSSLCFSRVEAGQNALASYETAEVSTTFYAIVVPCTLRLTLTTLVNYPHTTTVAVNGVNRIVGTSGTVDITISTADVNTLAISMVNGMYTLPANTIRVDAKFIL